MSSAPPLSYADILARLRAGSALSEDDETLAGEGREPGQPDPFSTERSNPGIGGILAEPLVRRVSGFGALAGTLFLAWQGPAFVGVAGASVWMAPWGVLGLLLGSLVAIGGLILLAYSVRNLGIAWTILLATLALLMLATMLVGGTTFAGTGS